MTFVPTKKESDKSNFQSGLMSQLFAEKPEKNRVVGEACERDHEEFLKTTEKTDDFLYNPVKDCICNRPKTLVKCVSCNYKSDEFAARVSKVCFHHPGLKSSEDLLRCPMCGKCNSLIEVQAPRPKTSKVVPKTSSQEETIGKRKFFPVTFVRNEDCTCGSRRNSPFLCRFCDFTASARVQNSCIVHPPTHMLTLSAFKMRDITKCPKCGFPA